MNITTKQELRDSELAHLDEVPITYVTTTAGALAAFEELSQAVSVSADTETVARNPDGTLRDLNVEGPGEVRVLSLAGKFATPDGTLRRAYVVDLGRNVAIDPLAAAEFAVSWHLSDTINIDRSALAPLVAQSTWYAWNADFDERVLDEAGLPPKKWKDLMLYQASLVLGSSGVSFYDSLAATSKRLLGVNIEGKGTVQLSYTACDPLSVEQIRYAAADAVATLDVSDVLEDMVASAHLGDAVALEVGARPFRSRMERVGIPFDVAGWRGFLDDIGAKLEAAEGTLAELTGGGQASLFNPVEKPNWNPASADAVKAALNRYAPEAVKALLGGRLFEKSDSIDNAALKLLDHPLARAMLVYREHAKTLSTYGESFITFVRSDGRVHARYMQNVVSTGRLSSSKPNMQNNDPAMKPFYRPANRPTRNADNTWRLEPAQRVFVLGDLGQAELRYAAQVSKDPALIDAFIRGDDMHVVTASRMFHVDMEALKEKEPKEYKTYRQRGKTMNFAVIYGLGPTALAQTLTLAGVPTSPDEAAELLRLYLAAFPEVAKWLEGRDATIESLQKNPPRCDFELTVKLANLLPKVNATRKALRTSLGYNPSNEQIANAISPRDELVEQLTRRLRATPSEEQVAEEMSRRCDMVNWASGFKAAVVVQKDGTAFAFESRTTVGRRRLFNVTYDQWSFSMIASLVRARRGRFVEIREQFEKSHDVSFSHDSKPISRDQLKKMLEDKDLRRSLFSFIMKSLGDAYEKVAYDALSDCIGGLANAYRNAPIQGGVADAVLLAYRLLDERLARFTNAVPVQSVHDSIVLEVNVEEALEVAKVLQASMEEGLSHFCPDVPAKADVDVAASLDAEKDAIEISELEAAFA